MKAENYIAFFTVCGFFFGLMFVVLKIDDPIEMMGYTFLITFFFYLIVHLAIMNYIDVNLVGKKYFDKEKHEEVNNYLVNELTIREKRMEGIISFERRPILLKKSGKKKNERSKAKAA